MLAGLTHIASMSGLKSWVGNRNGISAPVQSATNGGSHTAITPVNRRQLAAAQARMPPPPTRLARQPLQVAVDRPEAPTNNSVAPSHRELEDRSRVMAEQFDNQDHFGGAFDTDVEGMDETSILSETQVKDSQVDDQGAARTTHTWGTGQLDKDWNHAINQVGDDQRDAPMGNYEDENAEGTEDGEASGLEGEEDMSNDEALAPEDDATVVSMNLARELQEMKADSSWRPLVERPKERASIFNQQNQAIPKPAVRHFPERNTQGRGRARNGVHNTHNAYSDITSGDSDLDDENDEATRKKGQGPTDLQNGPYKSRKRPDSQPKVVRVPQVKQPHQMRPPPAQQPPEEVPHRSVKQEQPLNHHQSPDTGPQSLEADKTDHPKDIKPDLSDTNNNNDNDETNSHQNAAPPPTTTLLPEHPPPHPRKRRLSFDYDPTTLQTMTYTDLQTQPFDHNPNQPPSPLPESLLSAPLPSKLQHITTLPDDADRSTFFSTLPLAEWEDAGDWFVERFGELVKKMREARTERRRVAAEFEDEVARRKEYVRRSREGVEGEMRKMRKGGEDVLRNKVS